MRKHIVTLFFAMCLIFMTVSASADVLTKAERYDAALAELQKYLYEETTMPLDVLIENFDSLGRYKMSIELTYYTTILLSLEEENYGRVYQLLDMLKMNVEFNEFLKEFGTLGTLEYLEWYVKGRQAELNGDDAEAVTCYASCMSFMDSMARWDALQTGMIDEKYQEALAWYRTGTYEGYQKAYEIFLVLGNYEDSAAYLIKADMLRATPVPATEPTPEPVVPVSMQDNCRIIAAGYDHTVGVKADGSVVAVGQNEYRKLNVTTWHDIVEVSAGVYHTVGLKSDGTVVAVGSNDSGRCKVDGWSNVVAIAAGDYHTIGLFADGTAVGVGENEYKQRSVQAWNGITAIAAGSYHSVGLKQDGTVVALGRNNFHQCEVSSWTDIIAIAAGSYYTVGLRNDGTVVAQGNNSHQECDVSEWSDIVAIAAGAYHTVGLKADGTVVAIGRNSSGQCDVFAWKNIVAIAAGYDYTVAVKSDGSVITAGGAWHGRCDVGNWDLFR